MTWIELAKELYFIGQMIKARELLLEARIHATILAEKEYLG
jgi:hypothetical protein